MENKKLIKRKKQETANNYSIAMHRDSQMISKTKPKIRIIHIFAPEIIKTDAHNFRELVQKLTGKPTTTSDGGSDQNNSSALTTEEDYSSCRSMVTKLPSSSSVKQEEIIGGGGSLCTGGGYLGGFSDLELGFISEIDHGFPMQGFQL